MSTYTNRSVRSWATAAREAAKAGNCKAAKKNLQRARSGARGRGITKHTTTAITNAAKAVKRTCRTTKTKKKKKGAISPNTYVSLQAKTNFCMRQARKQVSMPPVQARSKWPAYVKRTQAIFKKCMKKLRGKTVRVRRK